MMNLLWWYIITNIDDQRKKVNKYSNLSWYESWFMKVPSFIMIWIHRLCAFLIMVDETSLMIWSNLQVINLMSMIELHCSSARCRRWSVKPCFHWVSLPLFEQVRQRISNIVKWYQGLHLTMFDSVPPHGHLRH